MGALAEQGRYVPCIVVRLNETREYTITTTSQSGKVVLRVVPLSSLHTVKKRYIAALLITRLEKALKTKPFTINNRLEAILHELTTYSVALARVIRPEGLLFVYTYPVVAPYIMTVLTDFVFRYWIAIERWDSYETEIVTPVHEALLLLIRKPYSAKFISMVRTPHLKCELCNDLLKDYGGKKKNLKPEGYVISDVWYEIPMYIPTNSNGFFQITKDVLDRILSIPNYTNADRTFLIVLSSAFYGVKILDDKFSPLKRLRVTPEEIKEVIR